MVFSCRTNLYCGVIVSLLPLLFMYVLYSWVTYSCWQTFSLEHMVMFLPSVFIRNEGTLHNKDTSCWKTSVITQGLTSNPDYQKLNFVQCSILSSVEGEIYAGIFLDCALCSQCYHSRNATWTSFHKINCGRIVYMQQATLEQYKKGGSRALLEPCFGCEVRWSGGGIVTIRQN